MVDTTSGIEPVFEFELIRRDRLGEHIMRHTLYDQWYTKHQKEIEKGEVKRPDWFVSASDLTPVDHVKVQAVIQKYVDASISKTVNAPTNDTVENVKKLYNLAYKLGCKGVTYMREGSRPGVLERKKEDKKEEVAEKQLPLTNGYRIKPRPMAVHGTTYRIPTPVGTAYITINTNGGDEPLEVFINGVGRAGSDLYAMAEGLGRIISLALRYSSHLTPHERVKDIMKQLEGIGGGRPTGFGKDRVKSLPDAVAKVLAMHYGLNGYGKVEEVKSNKSITHDAIPSQMVKTQVVETSSKNFDICPSCGEATLAHEEGCSKCYSCGHSEC